MIITNGYDALGHCIVSTDGEGKSTYQKFDALGLLVQKKLPDGTVTDYSYDSDSNLTECHLPNNTLWRATYDCMQRKCSEELRTGKSSSNRWEYLYEEGYLKKTIDPMHRQHTYRYDFNGRLSDENVDSWERHFTVSHEVFSSAPSNQAPTTLSSNAATILMDVFPPNRFL